MAAKKDPDKPSLEDAARVVVAAFRTPGGTSLETQENALDALEEALASA